MVRIPASTRSNIGDTKLRATAHVSAGPADASAPDLARKKDGNWKAPAGPPGAGKPEPLPPPNTTPPNDDPPPGSPYLLLPDGLRVTLKRSFRDHAAGVPGAEYGVTNAFDYNKQKPATLWEGLDKFVGHRDLNLVAVIYERIMNAYPAAWPFVRYVKQIWYGGSAGFGVVWTDRQLADGSLDLDKVKPGIKIGRDETYGAAEHQAKDKSYAVKVFSDADCHCYRELGVLEREGLHFCVATSDPEHDNIHIDWKDPAKSKDAKGYCVYDFGISAEHWLQAMKNEGVPASPFDYAFDYADIAARIARIRELAKTVKPRDPDAPGGVSTPPDFNGYCSMVETEIERVKPNWKNDYSRRLACRGIAGRGEASDIVAHVTYLPALEQEAKAWQ